MKYIFLIISFFISFNSFAQTNSNVETLIEKSTSLSQIVGEINFSFEQIGEKEISNDRKFVTVTYGNDSSVRPLVTYMDNGDLTQIIFLMPKEQAENIVKRLIQNYGTAKDYYGETVVKRGNLVYNYRVQDVVGMIIIYYN